MTVRNLGKKKYPYHDEQLTFDEIAARENVQPFTVYLRWHRYHRTERLPKTVDTQQHEYLGEMLTVEEIAKRENTDKSNISARVKYSGYATTLAQRGAKHPNSVAAQRFQYGDEQLTMSEIAAREGVTRQAIHQRVQAFGQAEKPKKGQQPKEPRQRNYTYVSKLVSTCSVCKQKGHNKARCPQKQSVTSSDQ